MSRRQAPPPPPPGLSDRAQRIWISETTGGTTKTARLVLLEEALRHLDAADSLRDQIKREGLTMTTKTTGTVHVHPLAKVELAHWTQFIKLAKLLDFEWDPA